MFVCPPVIDLRTQKSDNSGDYLELILISYPSRCIARPTSTGAPTCALLQRRGVLDPRGPHPVTGDKTLDGARANIGKTPTTK